LFVLSPDVSIEAIRGFAAYIGKKYADTS